MNKRALNTDTASPKSYILKREILRVKQITQGWQGDIGLIFYGDHNQASLINAASLLNFRQTCQMGKCLKNPLDLICGDFEWPIGDQMVDAVILWHSLETCINPKALLHEACRVIRPGGRMIILGYKPLSFEGINVKLMPSMSPRKRKTLFKWRVEIWLTSLGFQIERNTQKVKLWKKEEGKGAHALEAKKITSVVRNWKHHWIYAHPDFYVICARKITPSQIPCKKIVLEAPKKRASAPIMSKFKRLP